MPILDAAFWRDQAAGVRRQAELATDEAFRMELLEIARRYDERAERAEVLAKGADEGADQPSTGPRPPPSR